MKYTNKISNYIPNVIQLTIEIAKLLIRMCVGKIR